MFQVLNPDGTPVKWPLDILLDEKMDALDSLSVIELIEKLEKEYLTINKARVKILKDVFWVGKDWNIKTSENIKEIEVFTEEFNKILNQEIKIKKISIKAEGLNLSPKVILRLRELIDFTK